MPPWRDGTDVAARNANRLAALRNGMSGLVFQSFNLLPRDRRGFASTI
jgi:ABC-type lipoprotein export system ATPase subunit